MEPNFYTTFFYTSKGDNVMIQSTWWMMMDMDQPVVVDRLFIYGTLELDPAKPHTLQANLIMVSGLHGMLIAGWPNETMPNDVIIRLTGNHATPDFPITSSLNLGAKALGIFGLVSMHGRQHTLHWTRLAVTLNAGSTTLTMEDAAADWEVGSEIVVTTTSFESLETEKFIIRGISNDRRSLTLNNPAKYTHTAFRTTSGGRNVTMSAKVTIIMNDFCSLIMKIKSFSLAGILDNLIFTRVESKYFLSPLL